LLDRDDYLVTLARSAVLDWLHPLQETPVDRAIREEGERLRKAFPAIDFDHPGPRRLDLAELLAALHTRRVGRRLPP
jgi:hypothetical protein